MADPQLIVNADDFGLAEAVNAGILAAHERGIVTSTSLMVRQGAAGRAAGQAAHNPSLAVGLHLDLDGWDYERRLRIELAEPATECRLQLERFRELLGRDPTHLDSHHHRHEAEPVAAAAAALAIELGVPLRNRAIAYEGRFFGRRGGGEPDPEAITPQRLAALIEGLSGGWTELGCHPAAGPVPASSYDAERQAELRTLCDPGVRAALEQAGVRLRSFAEA